MNRDAIVLDNFSGIVKSLAKPSPNSFSELINLRLDRSLGGLANRYGIKNYLDLAYQPDAFGFARLPDCGDTLVLEGFDTTLDATYGCRIAVMPPYNLEDGSANTSLLDITTAIVDNSVAGVSGAVVTLGGAIPGVVATGPALYRIVFNSNRNEYAVVVAQGSATQVTLNRPVPTWINGDTLKLYKNEMLIGTVGFQRDLATVGYPLFQTIDAYNNLVLGGLVERASQSSFWVGRIGSKLGSAGSRRKYFGPLYDSVSSPGTAGFEFNGIYATEIAENFDSGAFRSSRHHIQAKVSSALVSTETIALNADITPGTYGGTWLDASSTPVAANFYTHIDDLSAVDYLSTTDLGAFFMVKFANLTAGQQANRNGYVNIAVYVRTGGSSIGQNATLFVDVVEIVGGTPVQRLGLSIPMISAGFFGGIVIPMSVRVDAFTNIDAMGLKFTYMGGNDSAVVMGTTATVDIASARQAIDNTGKNPDYALNFSLVLDDSQETSLIYSEPYGLANNTTSYLAAPADTCKASVGLGSVDKYIYGKFYTDKGELINRRVTGIRVYGGVFASGVWVWRYCDTIAMNSTSWIYTAATGEYSIELQIGNEINTGQVYEDRTGRSSGSTLQRNIATVAKPSSRAFIVNAVDKQTIYYSQISNNGNESTIIPASNFIAVNDTPGDIVWLISLGSKLLIFKRQSILAIEAYSASAAPRISVVSRERGTVAPQSVATDGLTAFYVSSDGIYATDGFKDQLMNQVWIEYFRETYTQAIVETAIGFFDVFTDSYFVQFKLGTNSYDLWAAHVSTGEWRKESFQIVDTQTFGAIKYVARALDNRNIIADDMGQTTSAYMQLYQYPRAADTDRYLNTIRTVSGSKKWGTRCEFKTNPVDARPLSNGYYIDGLYVKSNAKAGGSVLYVDATEASAQISTINMGIYDDTTLIKNIPVEWGREESTVAVRQPLSRFALGIVFFTRGLFAIKEIGIPFKLFVKSGNIKQTM